MKEPRRRMEEEEGLEGGRRQGTHSSPASRSISTCPLGTCQSFIWLVVQMGIRRLSAGQRPLYPDFERILLKNGAKQSWAVLF